MCTQCNLPSVSSINRILRNRAADRAAMAYARMMGRALMPMPYPAAMWQPPLYPFPDQLYLNSPAAHPGEVAESSKPETEHHEEDHRKGTVCTLISLEDFKLGFHHFQIF